MRGFLTTGITLALLCGGASAADGDRYTLEKSATGFVRMDRQTGEMSICEERAGQLVCKLAADERSAFESELERMQATVKALDERVVKLENSLASRLESKLPSDEDFEKTLGFMERFFRRFMDIVQDTEREGTRPVDPTKT